MSTKLPGDDTVLLDRIVRTERNAKQVVVLGSTGSIGENTLSVIEDNADTFSVFALSTNRRLDILEQQILKFQPQLAVVANAELYKEAEALQRTCREQGAAVEVLVGHEALDDLAGHRDTDIVVAGIVGAAGLSSTLAAARSGKQLLLANKEAIVMGGRYFVDAVRENGGQVLPVDSEHNAIFQCLPDNFTQFSVNGSFKQDGGCPLRRVGISKILLTGSGGPFREWALSSMPSITPEQACKHPNWSMGRKISVDSATMMNKGLELIEACWLFGCDEAAIDIVVHPQSIVHSMVQYSDGSVLAQMGKPDMRTPIAHALAWPNRIGNQVEALDWTTVGQLTFEQPDPQRFPSLALARDVAQKRDHSAIVLNAANEEMVEAFLAERIRFDQIVQGVEQSLAKVQVISEPQSLQEIMAIDHETRHCAKGLISKFSH